MAKPAAPAKPSSAPAPGRGGKRPAWDLKGRLEDMEKMFSQTNARVTDLECEKRELQTDVEVKKEVVVQNSEEIKDLRKKIGAYIVSKTIEIRFVLLLLRHKLSHSGQDQTRSVLDRIRHDQGFPNL